MHVENCSEKNNGTVTNRLSADNIIRFKTGEALTPVALTTGDTTFRNMQPIVTEAPTTKGASQKDVKNATFKNRLSYRLCEGKIYIISYDII